MSQGDGEWLLREGANGKSYLLNFPISFVSARKFSEVHISQQEGAT